MSAAVKGVSTRYHAERSTQSILEELIGLQLSIARNIAGMEVFHFGVIRQNPHGRGTVGSHALHVQCSWRLVGTSGILTGLCDCATPYDPDQEEVDAENMRSGNLQRAKLLEYLGHFDDATNSPIDPTGQHVVVSVCLDQYHTLDIAFADGTRLQVFPDCSRDEDWRFISIEASGNQHLVVAGGKVETN